MARTKGAMGLRSSGVCADLALKCGVTPFEILLQFAAGKHKKLGYSKAFPPAIRAKAAADACKYLYPQLQAAATNIDGLIKVVIEDYTRKPDA